MNMIDYNIYACGPTLYSDVHIGNARPLVLFDVVAEYYRRIGRNVKYARNITDVDDKIISLCGDQHPGDWVKAHTLPAFRDVEKYLGLLPPDVEPFASDYIEQMHDMISELIGKGFASLQVHGDESGIYFKSELATTYGRLSNRQTKQNFALWKTVSDESGEYVWKSPWGTGRPGWHTECAAMIRSIFNGPVDLHGGGTDLTFPHHENEDVQCMCAYNHPVAKSWLRNSHLLVDGKKMAKSDGNFITVKSLMSDWSGSAVRHMLLKTNPNRPIDFTFKLLAESEKIVTRKPLAALPTDQPWNNEQLQALAQNFNTSLASMRG